MNSLLCFLSSAKDDHTDESLLEVTNSFYSHEEIKDAKVELSSILKKDIVWRRDPSKKSKDLKDVIDLCDELVASQRKVRFVTDTYKKMPPIGMELIAPILVNLTEEVARISDLLPKILDIKTEVLNSADSIRQMRVDVNGIKSNFDQAIYDLKEASCDIAENEFSIGEDLRSFRMSLGATAGVERQTSAQEAQHPRSTLATGEGGGPERVTDGKQSSSIWSEVVTRRSTGAVSKAAGDDRSSSAPVQHQLNRVQYEMESPIRRNSDGEEMEEEGGGGGGSGDWTVVGGREREQRQRRRLRRETPRVKPMSRRVVGSRKAVQQLRAVKRTADIFLGRIDNDISSDNIKDYITDNFQVKVCNIEQLIIKTDQYKAFKVTVDLNDREKLFKPELWPEYVLVDKFYNRSKNHSPL